MDLNVSRYRRIYVHLLLVLVFYSVCNNIIKRNDLMMRLRGKMRYVSRDDDDDDDRFHCSVVD